MNTIYETATSTNVCGIRADPADKRISFYYATGIASQIAGFAAETLTQFPVYLPVEKTLIKAEAYARQANPDLVNALIELN